jgi:hypothetical protein
VPGIWTSLTCHHHSIPWPIDRVFRIPLIISWRPELTALLTAFPRAVVLILIVGIAQAEALVLHLAPPTPAKRQKRRITTNPLITTRRFDQRRCGIATEATMFSSYRFGSHAVVCHALSLCVGLGRDVANALTRGTAAPIALSSPIMSISTYPPPCAAALGACERAQR